MSDRERLRVSVGGAVQGVGYRPFVYRLASDLRLDGFVVNSLQGVLVEVEGPHQALETFRARISSERPPRAVVYGLEASWLDPVGLHGFDIRESTRDGDVAAFVLPDIATCDECRRELFDPANRRFRYPFINCTHCGPRFSIIEALPYDRGNTSMKRFTMCEACQREYDDPLDRRFHAQPNACPVCGPHLELWAPDGGAVAMREDAVRVAVTALRDGLIVAVKGLGGFHLLTDARNHGGVERLRDLKHREEKPFALMYPDLVALVDDAPPDAAEVRLLTSPESPIVLLRRKRRARSRLSPSVAPGAPTLGVMLPYTPVHALLLHDFGGPVVATSGNRADEPICIDEREALARLDGIADLFLVHDRPIVRHVDDSIVRMVLGRELMLRRARGYAPLPILLREPVPPSLAVGGHLKNTVAVASGRHAFVSQHIGDLESTAATDAFFHVVQSLESLMHIEPKMVAADLHPDYLSTRYADGLGVPVTHVQHHLAHIASCMADNDLVGDVLGVAWDGTGYGPDGTIWGGEFLSVSRRGFQRVACLRPFRLPGGEQAVREPRRSALGLLDAMALHWREVRDLKVFQSFTARECAVLWQALAQRINAPLTTSAGRLFDAAAAIVGVCERSTFEGQAAMALEAIAEPSTRGSYPFLLQSASGTVLVVDWEPAIRALIEDTRSGVPRPMVSARFHNTLAEMIVAVAEAIEEPRVVLSGGCFQNRYLLEGTVSRLRHAGFKPYWHQRLPPNDGGISVGQLVWMTQQRELARHPSPQSRATPPGSEAQPCA